MRRLIHSPIGTNSVIHNDDADNLNCLLDGRKSFITMDFKYAGLIETSGGWEEGHANLVDTDALDLDQFPAYKEIPHRLCEMEKGDCLYIPRFMFHQVRSFGRNFAVNVWWHRFTQFDENAGKVEATLSHHTFHQQEPAGAPKSADEYEAHEEL